MSITLCFLIAAVLITCDRFIKVWAINALAPVSTIQLIPGVVKLTYVENIGAAFGIFQGQRLLLILVTAVIIAVAGWLMVSGRIKKPLERLCVALILAGGIGNLIDRILRGFVVDYIDINELFTFPMFNLADCCVVAGTVLMVFLVLRSEFKDRLSAGDK